MKMENGENILGKVRCVCKSFKGEKENEIFFHRIFFLGLSMFFNRSPITGGEWTR